MGALMKVVLSLSLFVAVVTRATEEKKSDIRSSDINVSLSRMRAGLTTRCLSWDCRRRQLMLQKRLMDAVRSAKPASPEEGEEEEDEEVKCISWNCKRKRRSLTQVPQPEEPQTIQQDINSNEVPCLTSDCRAGKKSLDREETKSDEVEPKNSLRLKAHSIERRSPLGCIIWHCNGKRR